MSAGDDRPVAFGRWEAEHQRLRERVDDLAKQLNEKCNEIDRRLGQELQELRHDFDEETRTAAQEVARRRDRQWNLILAFLTALVLPLAVAAIVAVLTASHS